MSRTRKILSYTFVGLAIFLASFSFYVYQAIQSPNLQVKRASRMLFIPKGTDFQGLLALLKKDSIVSNVVSFAFLSKIMNYQEHVKPGAYLIEENMSNMAAIRMLRAGKQTAIKVTFNSLRTKEDLAERLAKQLPFSEQEWLEILQNEETSAKYGFDAYTFSTMFIPNTYEVYWTTSREEFIEKMYKEYQKFWNKERLAKAEKIGLNPKQVSVLASIVQAETAKNDEKPRVAGVYLNRLVKNDYLQADPTVIFALKDFTIKRVLDVHLQTDSPYNTYKYTGLPPGAINFPEVSSIDAVLNAEQHDYYFFCAKEDFSGYHNFAKTLAEHNRNARLYQQALTAKGIR